MKYHVLKFAISGKGDMIYGYIAGVDMEKDIKTIPVPYGGLVLFNNLTPHRRWVSLCK